jgi:phosphoribosylformylglycinamidine synthase
MRIGMGGGAASSMATGTNAAELDFDSVQRGNPEIERRAQEVINHCWALGAANPILAIHDVGAGGLSNAFPELTNDAGRGARFDLRAVPLEESGLAPKEIWSNESQERYVLAIAPESLPLFRRFCERERCPFAVVGVATEERQLVLDDPAATADDQKLPVDMPMNVLLGKPPKMHRDVKTVAREFAPMDLTGVPLQKAVIDVLSHPTVASKRFLITIGDRTVGGLTPPRPDGRPLAGAGGRLRRDAGRLQGLCRRGHEHGRAHAAGRLNAPHRAAWPWPRPSPTCWPRPSSCRASSCPPTGWPPAASPAKTPRCTPP